MKIHISHYCFTYILYSGLNLIEQAVSAQATISDRIAATRWGCVLISALLINI